VFADERLHGAGFLGRDDVIGVRDAAEQVGKRTEIPGAVRFEMIERLERLTQRSELVLLRAIGAQPGANRLQGHAQEYPDCRRYRGRSRVDHAISRIWMNWQAGIGR
jgi:hypothetical protein